MSQRTLFHFIASFLEKPTDRLLLCFNSNDQAKEQMTVSVSVLGKDNAIKYSPLVVRGTYAEMNQQNTGLWSQMNKYKEEVLAQQSNLEMLKKEIEEAQKEQKKALEKAKKPVEIKKNRCAGAVDEDILLNLISADRQSEDFKKAVESANLQTILAGLKDLSEKKKEKARFNKLSSELKKITGSNAEEQGIEYSPASTTEKNEEAVSVSAPQGLFDELPQ